MLTNKHGLPRTFVKALERDHHKGADYSASQLNKPPRMVHLEKRHRSEAVEDVTDKIWALFGSAVHAILEQGETSSQLAEQYMEEEVSGVTISGTPDLYEDGIVYDYKVTSAFSYIYMADKIKEWESQLNTYAWLFEKTGFKVKGLKIVMILRDWMASKAKFDKSYPDCQVQMIDINLNTPWDTENYLTERVKVYEDVKDVADDDLPLCSEDDRWVKPSVYAVMKKGRKSALKLCSSNEEAKTWMATNGKGEYIDERKAEQYKRCEYCSVSAFCNQYNDNKEK